MLVIVNLSCTPIMLIQDETEFENVSKVTAKSGRIKNWRVSTVGQYTKITTAITGQTTSTGGLRNDQLWTFAQAQNSC